MFRLMKSLTLLLAFSLALLPIQPALAEGDLPAGAIPASPPIVYRINDDGSRAVVATATSAYIVPALPPTDGSGSVMPLPETSLTASLEEGAIAPLSLGEGYYNHYAYYTIGGANAKQTTYFYQDQFGSQLIYWTKWESTNSTQFGIVWFRFRNMATSQVCCSWQINQWSPYTKTTNTYVDSRGSGTRLENFLDDNTNWSADYYVEFVVGI